MYLHVEGASHSEVIRREEVHHDRPHQGVRFKDLLQLRRPEIIHVVDRRAEHLALVLPPFLELPIGRFGL